MEAKQYNTKQPMDSWRNQNLPGDKWNWKHNNPTSVELGQGSSEREVYSDNSLPQETKTFSNKQSSLRSLKEREKEQAKPKFSTKKEIIKIRAEINETETKKAK